MCLHEIVNGVKLRIVNNAYQARSEVRPMGDGSVTRRIRILIVEDEPGVAMAMRLVLGLANFEAQIAATKTKAIEMAESGAMLRSREKCQPRGRIPAVKIDRQVRRKIADRAKFRRQNAVDIGVAFENRLPSLFRHHRDRAAGKAIFQQVNGGGQQDAIAQRPQSYQQNSGLIIDWPIHWGLQWSPRRSA